MNINDVYGSGEFLHAADLNGRDVTLTILECAVGEWPDGSSQVVLTFDKTDRKLGLNKTNASTIADGYGFDTTGWPGKSITIFPTDTDYQGRRTPCIRIRPIGAVQIASAVLGGEGGTPPDQQPASFTLTGTETANPTPPVDDDIPF